MKYADELRKLEDTSQKGIMLKAYQQALDDVLKIIAEISQNEYMIKMSHDVKDVTGLVRSLEKLDECRGKIEELR